MSVSFLHSQDQRGHLHTLVPMAIWVEVLPVQSNLWKREAVVNYLDFMNRWMKGQFSKITYITMYLYTYLYIYIHTQKHTHTGGSNTKQDFPGDNFKQIYFFFFLNKNHMGQSPDIRFFFFLKLCVICQHHHLLITALQDRNKREKVWKPADIQTTVENSYDSNRI